MHLPDQTGGPIGNIFWPLIYVILDYKNIKYELDPLTLSLFHHLAPEGTEIKKTTSTADFDQSILKRCVILYTLKQKKNWGVDLTRS